MTDLELSLPYVAGLFDGEGSVGIYQGRRGGWTFRIQMTQNESPGALTLWMTLCDRWGGHVSHARSANGRAKMNWQLGQERAARFLRDIRPWLILKAEQADVALAWLDSRPTLRRDPLTGQNLPRSAKDVAATRVAADQLKRLKRQDIDQVRADAVDLVEERHTHLQMVNVQGE